MEQAIKPILTQKGLKTNPEFSQISSMTMEQLSKLENFSIENEHCRVQFEDSVDLRGANLDDIFKLNFLNAEVYRGETAKPMEGYGLNVPAVVSYLNLGVPKSEGEFKEFEKKCVKLVKERKAFFLDLNKDSDSLTFKVLGF